MLQRNLSWVDDGWATLATVGDGISTYERDNKRYRMYCGYSMSYRLKNINGAISQSSPIHPGRGWSGERC